jgi:hypothetical protein
MRTSYRTGVIEVFTRPESNVLVRLLGLLIRSRAELTIAAVLLTARFWAWPGLDDRLGHPVALLLVTVLVLSILVTPASRRFLSRRWWSITTRHRMRACYVQTRTMTHNGKLPYLLWSRPSSVGERVRVWLPAGLAVKDLEQVAPETAAACRAADVRVTPSRKQAALVVVDVIRRDPLTGEALHPQVIDDVDPTAPHDWGDQNDADENSDTGTGVGGTVVPLPTRTALPAPLPTGDTRDGHNPTAAKPRTRKEPTTPVSSDEPPVTGFGGLDVSDYV